MRGAYLACPVQLALPCAASPSSPCQLYRAGAAAPDGWLGAEPVVVAGFGAVELLAVSNEPRFQVNKTMPSRNRRTIAPIIQPVLEASRTAMRVRSSGSLLAMTFPLSCHVISNGGMRLWFPDVRIRLFPPSPKHYPPSVTRSLSSQQSPPPSILRKRRTWSLLWTGRLIPGTPSAASKQPMKAGSARHVGRAGRWQATRM
jgi:hypothetical protein